MPLYEYHCDACSTTITAMRSIANRDVNPICAGDFIIDSVSGDAQIENGKKHPKDKMHRIISRLGPHTSGDLDMPECKHPDLRDLAFINGSKGRVVNVLQCRRCGALIERTTKDRPLTDQVVLGKLMLGGEYTTVNPKWGERDG